MDEDYNPYRENAEIARSQQLEREREVMADEEAGDDGSPIPLESTPITDEFLNMDADIELDGFPEDPSLRDH